MLNKKHVKAARIMHKAVFCCAISVALFSLFLRRFPLYLASYVVSLVFMYAYTIYRRQVCKCPHCDYKHNTLALYLIKHDEAYCPRCGEIIGTGIGGGGHD